jgi:hypothetical protein
MATDVRYWKLQHDSNRLSLPTSAGATHTYNQASRSLHFSTSIGHLDRPGVTDTTTASRCITQLSAHHPINAGQKLHTDRNTSDGVCFHMSLPLLLVQGRGS